VNPAAEYAKERIKVVSGILSKMEPITDIKGALQCPLSEGVQRSLELACADEKGSIMTGLHRNSALISLKGHLQHLRLLHDALKTPDVVLSYTSALEQIRNHAIDRTEMARSQMSACRLTLFDEQSFSQVRSLLTSLNGDLEILTEYMEKIGEPNVLVRLKSEAARAINKTCESYFAELNQALLHDDFDSATKVLKCCEGLLENLKEHVLGKNKDMATHGAFKMVTTHMYNNAEKARTLISDKCFDSKLACVLDVIRKSSEHTALLQYVQTYSDTNSGRFQEIMVDLAKLEQQAAEVKKAQESSASRIESAGNGPAAARKTSSRTAVQEGKSPDDEREKEAIQKRKDAQQARERNKDGNGKEPNMDRDESMPGREDAVEDKCMSVYRHILGYEVITTCFFCMYWEALQNNK